MHHWRSHGHPGQAHSAVVRLLISSAVLKAETPAPHVLARPVAKAGRQAAVARQQGCLELAASAPGARIGHSTAHMPQLVSALPSKELPRAKCRVQVLPGCLWPTARCQQPSPVPSPTVPSGLSPACQPCGRTMVPAHREPRAAVMMSISLQTSVVY